MEISTRVNGKTIELAAGVYSWTLIMLAMKASGAMICNMGKAQRLGTMEQLGMLDSSTRA